MTQWCQQDIGFMQEAIAEAKTAAKRGEVPIGCVIARDGKVLARAHNGREASNDPTAHAEILALRLAAAKLGSWRLDRCTIYVTIEPCPMCAGALVNARVSRLVYGAHDPKAGACSSLYKICSDKRLNHTLQVQHGLLASDCGRLLTDFFTKLRLRGLQDDGYA